MMMQMLHAGDIEILTDKQREADDDNPRGYFELEKVKQLDKDNAWIADAHGKAIKVISQLLFKLPADHEYKIIFMERDIPEILRSQQKMLDRRGEKGAGVEPGKLQKAFEGHLEKVVNWLDKQGHIQVLHVPYADVVKDPLSCAEKVREFLGLDMDVQAMAAAVDPNLYRNRVMK